MLLWLRRIASCFFFTLAVLFAALWVRSNYCVDILATFRYFTNDDVFPARQSKPLMLSGGGILEVRCGDEAIAFEGNNKLPRFEVYCKSPSWNPQSYPWSWHVYNIPTGTVRIVRFPHYIVVFVAFLLAIAIRPKPRFKFSFRDLLTLTTVAALAFWLRSISS
jgi:hypothetical protein